MHTVTNQFQALIKAGEYAFQKGDLTGYREAIRLGGKALRNLANVGQMDAALSLEPAWYNSLVKKVESESHYHQSFSWHANAFWEAGQRNARGTVRSGRPNRIAFVAHSGALLGHTEVMLRIIESWKSAAPHIEPYFVSLIGLDSRLKDRLSRLNVPFGVAPPEANSPTHAVKWARDFIADTEVETCVWLSTPCWVGFVFGLGLAPKQILWSLKFHAVHLGPSVIHVGMTKPVNGKVMINGSYWRAFSPPLTTAVKTRAPCEVEQVRCKWSGQFLFGTLAREEKFNSPEFITAVVRILQSAPNSHYLYTGKKPPFALAQALTSAGLAHRSTFIGWVDTELYAQAIDAFLETFPFGCGVTGAQAVSLGTRMVSLWAEDSLPRFYFQELTEAKQFSPNWAVCESIDTYVTAALSAYTAGRAVGDQRRTSPLKQSLAALDSNKAGELSRLFELPEAQ